jgi:hypothetical protein
MLQAYPTLVLSTVTTSAAGAGYRKLEWARVLGPEWGRELEWEWEWARGSLRRQKEQGEGEVRGGSGVVEVS